MDKKFVMSIAAMAALTLVSCSSDDLDSFSDNSSKNEAISFDGYLGRSAVAVNGSRGSVVDINALKDTELGKKVLVCLVTIIALLQIMALLQSSLLLLICSTMSK